MRNRITILLSALIGLTLLLSACAPAAQQELPAVVPSEVPATEVPTPVPPTSEPEVAAIVITDDLGAEITLEGPAQAIISISPSLTEILYAVGAGDRLIGRDSNSTYPQEALTAADLGGMWDGIPVEDILAMEPDLILAGEIFSADAIAELRDLGLPVYWQANPDDFEGLYENIRAIAILTGTEEQAAALVADLSAQVAAVDGTLADVDQTPLVFYELDASEPANPWTAGGGTFISYVITRAKGQNLGDSLEGEWVQISSEALVAQDPDVILLADEIYGITAESVAERPGWSEIAAVQEGKIFGFDPFILSVPGPRLVEGYQVLAELLHPEAWE
jgi:iron complex transport system substrate-binding protein